MFEVSIDGKPVKAEVTFNTALIYEQEFGGDIISDLLGVQGDTDGVIAIDDAFNVVSIDFTKVKWLPVTKGLWAAIKTADASAPSYGAWMREAMGMNLLDFRQEMLEEMVDCFFRAEAAGEEASE